MMINWGLIGAILLPNIGGWASATSMIGQVRRRDGKAWYQLLHKPSWTPPNWVFGPIWMILYSIIGWASYRVYEDVGGFTAGSVFPLALYGAQLVFNWTWTPIFFRLHQIGWAAGHMVVLDVAALACTISFFRVALGPGLLMLPYLAWLGFGTCLNFSIWKLNQPSKNAEKPE